MLTESRKPYKAQGIVIIIDRGNFQGSHAAPHTMGQHTFNKANETQSKMINSRTAKLTISFASNNKENTKHSL